MWRARIAAARLLTNHSTTVDLERKSPAGNLGRGGAVILGSQAGDVPGANKLRESGSSVGGKGFGGIAETCQCGLHNGNNVLICRTF